jgi:iron complex outermembrane receptor protein
MTVAAAVAMSISGPALAQEDPISEVTVTGSRIAQAPGMATATPVTSVVADELKQLAPTNLIESLTALPVFSANTNQQQALGGQNSGGSNVNLHGAGANRTLTLLDGRRLVSSNRFGTVDVNSLPDMLLNNVETVTGGASASYGTDAVAGVVNFKLDTRFEGLKAKIQRGTTDRHDGDSEEYGLAIGHGFFDDRAHFIGSLQYANQDSISDVEGIRSRPWLRQEGRVTNPNTAGPSFLRRPYVVPTNFTTRGMFIEPAVTAGGVTTPANAALNRMVFNSSGTSLSPLPFYGVGARDGGCLCQSLPGQDLTPNGVSSDDEVAVGFRRVNGFARLGFDVTDNLEVFAQGLWAKNSANQRRESVALVSANVWQGRVFADNAYLPANVANLIATTTPASRATVANGGVRYADMSVFIPDNEFNAIGDTRQITSNAMSSVTLGFKARFADRWTMDGFIQQGRNRQDFDTVNGIRVDRLFVAMDAVRDPNGNIVCRASLPSNDPNGYFRDCAPINLFGGAGTVTPEAARYIRDDYKVASQWIEQTVGELAVSGDLGFGLPAGTISSAFGVSYREDKLDQRTVDPADEFPATLDGRLLSSLGLQAAGLRGIVPQQGCATLSNGSFGVPGLRFVPNSYCGDGNSSSVQFSSLRTIGGESDVKEAFTEFQIPLLKDLPFVQRLETNLAARWADYSGSGNVWAYKGGLSWEVDDQIRVRATRSRDVRAANLRDRFDQTRGGFTVTDRFFTPARTVSGTSFSGGNPDVAPEKADTTTVGIVFQPSFLTGFQASVDWWNIDISDAITQLTSQQLVDRCVAGDASLCQYVIRAGNNDIIQIDSLFINLNNQKIEGVDIELGYRRGVELLGGGPENVSLRLFGTRLMHNVTQAPGGTPDEQVGQIATVGLPKWKATGILTYANGPVSSSVIGRFVGAGILDRTLRESATAIAGVTTIDNNQVGSAFYTDLTLNFSPPAFEGLRVYGTAQNVLDHAPPQTPGAIGRTGIADTAGGAIHDQLGRRYTVGVEYKF